MGFSFTSVLVAVAMVAPAMASDKALACDKWQRNLMVKGDFIKQVHQPDAHWCKKQCMMTEGCEASTFHKTGHRQGECSMFKLNDRSVLTEAKDHTSWIPCGECNERETDTEVGGGRVLDSFQIKDFWWCRKKCTMMNDCNAFTFEHRQCTLMDIAPGMLTREEKKGTQSYVMCDRYGVLDICGVKGGPLCPSGDQCKNGLTATSDNTCDCGGMWQPCCNGDCEGNMTCDMNGGGFGQCAPCGGDAENDYQMCCPDETCNQDDKRRVCLPHGGCAPCGELWQAPCADEPKCADGLEPDARGQQCTRGDKW